MPIRCQLSKDSNRSRLEMPWALYNAPIIGGWMERALAIIMTYDGRKGEPLSKYGTTCICMCAVCCGPVKVPVNNDLDTFGCQFKSHTHAWQGGRLRGSLEGLLDIHI